MTTRDDDILANETVPDKRTATRLARTMGCEGAHQAPSGNGWHPCESHEALTILINRGSKGYRAWKERQGKTKVRTVLIDDKKPKKRKYRKPKGWENLAQRGVRGINTLPGGGLTSLKSDSEYRRVR